MASNPRGVCRVVSEPALGRQGVVMWGDREVDVIVSVGVACLRCVAAAAGVE